MLFLAVMDGTGKRQVCVSVNAIPDHAKLAVFALNLEVMSLLVKGTFLGLKKARGMTFGSIDIEQVYNTMPPVPGQIYPELAVRKKVEQFTLS